MQKHSLNVDDITQSMKKILEVHTLSKAIQFEIELSGILLNLHMTYKF